jgi:hypothetical protein
MRATNPPRGRSNLRFNTGVRVGGYLVLGAVLALTGCGAAHHRSGGVKLPGSGPGPLTQRITDEYVLVVDRCSAGAGNCRLTFADGKSLKCTGAMLRIEEAVHGVVVRGGTCVKAPVARIAWIPARCSAAQLVLWERPTGGSIGAGIEGPFDFVLDNHSAFSCSLDGYPRLVLSAHGRRLPLLYQHGGRAVSKRQPRPLVLASEAEAFFALTEGRCESARAELATSLHILLPGARGEIRTALPRPLGYCLRRQNYPSPMSGRLISVSPIAASTVEAAT